MQRLQTFRRPWLPIPGVLSLCKPSANRTPPNLLLARRYGTNADKNRGNNPDPNTEKTFSSLRSSLWPSGRQIVTVIILLASLEAGFLYFGAQPEGPFQPPRFTPFEIVSREIVSPTSIVLTLRPQARKRESIPYNALWRKGTWSVEVKQPQLQIARSYTPLPDNLDDLKLFIRKEVNGEVSGYLHKLPVGAIVEMRGPNTELELEEDLKDVVFLAGGTGIAPALQVVKCLLDSRAKHDDTRIRIIWANRRREDCREGRNFENGEFDVKEAGYVVQELHRLKKQFPSQLSVDFVVDEEGTSIDQARIKRLTDRETEKLQTGGGKLLIVSGPEGFINHFAGPKHWEGGKERQGVIGGVLGGLNLSGWKVWKL